MLGGFKPEMKIFLLVALIAVVISVGGILLLRTEGIEEVDNNGLPLGKVSYDFLKSRPEAHLYYPGSKVFSLLAGPEERNFIEGGKNSAYVGAKLISNDSPEQIYRWYKDWMLSNGWQPRDIARVTFQISAEGYARGSRERFSVAVNDPELLSGTLGQEILQDGGTIFDIIYLVTPASR